MTKEILVQTFESSRFLQPDFSGELHDVQLISRKMSDVFQGCLFSEIHFEGNCFGVIEFQMVIPIFHTF